jgi:transcriptional regulator of acetoin/glycerol metabolism
VPSNRAAAAPRPSAGAGVPAVNLDVSYSQARADLLRDFDRAYLDELMRATDGNLSAAARRSGIDRSNLRRMLRQLGLVAPGGSD